VQPDAGSVRQRDAGQRDPVALGGKLLEQRLVQGTTISAGVGGSYSNEITVSVT